MNEKRGPTSGQLEFTFSRRALFIGGVQAVVGGVVATRMAYIAVAENENISWHQKATAST